MPETATKLKEINPKALELIEKLKELNKNEQISSETYHEGIEAFNALLQIVEEESQN